MAEMETVGSETKAPDERCRVCLEIHSETMSLYEEIKIEGFQKETLSKILFDCGNVRADRNDNNPKTICTLCLEKAKEAYKFKLMCEKANNILQREIIDDLFNMFNIEDNRTFNKIEMNIKDLPEAALISKKKVQQKNLRISSLVSYNSEETGAKKLEEIKLQSSSNMSRATPNVTRATTKLSSRPTFNLKCNMCSKTLKNLKAFRKHMQVHQCRFCDYVSKTSVTKHMNEEHNEHAPYICSECGKRYFKKGNLDIHKFTHTDVKPYVCEVCGLGVSYITNFRHHMRSHTGERPFTCSTCGKTFQTKKILDFHEATHSTVRSYVCDVCGSTYKTKPQLANHKLRHQPKRHKCSVCDKLYQTKCELKKHVREVHLGIRNHKCEVCEKRFPNAYDLKEHMRVHTGEKPHICHMCGAAFSARVSLRMHFKNHHKDSV